MTTPNCYYQGALVQVQTTFADASSSPMDPAGIKLTYEPPDTAPTTLVYGTDAGLVKDSTGKYHVNLDTTPTPGIWRYTWLGTGNGQAAAQSQFTVLPSKL